MDGSFEEDYVKNGPIKPMFQLDSFFYNHVQADKNSFMSPRQIFIAYRSFINVKFPSVVASMDYKLFKLNLQEYAEIYQYPKQYFERNVMYGIKFCQLEALGKMQKESKELDKSEENVKIKAHELNTIICCKMCFGYLVEPYTIQECLHSFCKTCITRHFYTSIYCPFCNIMVSEINPFDLVKRDMLLQQIVDKLLPGLVESEKARQREFERKNELSNICFKNTTTQKNFDFILEWVGPLKCTIPTEHIANKFTRVNEDATIGHVKQLVLETLGKLNSSIDATPVVGCSIISGEVILPSFLSLKNLIDYDLVFEKRKKMPLLRYDLVPIDSGNKTIHGDKTELN